MRVGLAAAEITPPPNVPLDGFETRKTGSRGVHDPLFAHALVAEDGGVRVGWVIADLVGVPAAVTARVRAEAAARAGIRPERLMVSATHTHGGPSPHPAPAVAADHAAHAEWLAALPEKLAEAVVAAAAALEPAELALGCADCGSVQHNRRFLMKDGTVKMVWDNPEPAFVARLGPVDPDLNVVTIRAAGRVQGLLIHFTCHPTTLVGDNFLVTADWPGVARAEVRSLLGVPGLWVAVAQGCCGDITPSPPRGTFPICEAKGKEIARCAARAWEARAPVAHAGVAASTVPVRLPRKAVGLDPAPTGDDYAGEVQALRLGDVAVVGLPGEPLVEIGLAIKAAPGFRATLAGGYANDYDDAGLGYIPTAAEYPRGGYEVTAAGVAPGADAILVAAGREALERLAAGSRARR